MDRSIGFIGFGEAAQTFVGEAKWANSISAYDIKTRSQKRRDQKLAEYKKFGITPCESTPAVVGNATVVLSLVTADQALIAAEHAARHLQPESWFFDMNSAAPARKRDAAKSVSASGTRYVDVAIMAPVIPSALGVPLLVSGEHAPDATKELYALGFKNVKAVGAKVGDASAIKMIRSVMIKGIEALTAECLLAASKADIVEELIDAMGSDWAIGADYNLERMLVHGNRRAAEMEEVCDTLVDFGVGPFMSIATVQRQRALGQLGGHNAPRTLDEKLSFIRNNLKADAL